MTKEKVLSKKAEELQQYIKASFARYEAENVPESERGLFITKQCVEAEIIKHENDIVIATNADEVKANAKNLCSAVNKSARVNVIQVCKKYIHYCESKGEEGDSMMEKALGCNTKALRKLLRTDWVTRTYEKLGIHKVAKTCFVFNLFRWKVENNSRLVHTTGSLTDREIAELLGIIQYQKDDKGKFVKDDKGVRIASWSSAEVEAWKKEHRCQVLVDIYSDTLKYTKYSKATLAGIFYAEKLINECAVLEAIQCEYSYKAFLEGRKTNLKVQDAEKLVTKVENEKVNTENNVTVNGEKIDLTTGQVLSEKQSA